MARTSQNPFRILTVFGTRPEAIKLAPVIRELRSRTSVHPLVCVSGQHRQILDQMLRYFEIQPDFDIQVMTDRQSLSGLSSKIIDRLDVVFEEARPDFVLVQGDTTTTFLGALVAFYHRIPVGHVEAGLRTHDKWQPFPEELNRRLCDVVSDLYFAPTEEARDSLLAEGIDSGRIEVTGNTVVDTLLWTKSRLSLNRSETRRKILVTAHRRESWGEPMRGICEALLRLCARFPDLEVRFPVHPNPAVREVVEPVLAGHGQIHLSAPLDYPEFVQAMSESTLILTDSGGVQEEAPSLDVPVLVLRDTTERPEAVAAGAAIVVGTDPTVIEREATLLLTDGQRYQAMASAPNPFGDGRAAVRIVDRVLRYLTENQR